MNNKKIYAAFTAALMTVSIGLAGFTACGPDHECVYTYKTKVPATCMSAGVEEGVCGICNESYNREIPVDENAHSYGEWNIVKPTESAEGTATAVCKYNQTHIHTVSLPKLTEEGTGYTSSEITLSPTALKAGERTFVLEDAIGDIMFKIPVPAHGVQTVADAVEVGVAGAEQVRYSYGKSSSNRLNSAISEFYYEFGENYTHLIDSADKYESWYSYDEKGQLFGIRREGISYDFENGKPGQVVTTGGKPKQDPLPNAGYMKGERVVLYYSSSVSLSYYGAEECLDELYKWMLASTNGDAYEEIVKDGNETVYKFGFGSYNSPYFCELKVEFTLTETNALKHLLVESYDYDNTWSKKFEQDPETKYYHVIDGAEVSGIELIEFTNTTEAELSPEEAAEKPVNPYPATALQLKSLDVIESSTGNVVDDNSVITVNADVMKDFRFANIENIGPDINDIEYDPITVYLRTETRDIELDYYIGANKVLGYCNTSTTMQIRSRLAGDLTFVLKSKSGSFEKEFKLHVNPIAPSKITPSYHKYGNTGYTWQQTSSDSITATVYVNQPVPFKADVSNDELSYVSTGFEAQITSSNSANAKLTWTSEARDVMEFRASAVGTYTIRLMSSLNRARTCTITVKVVAPPPMGSLFGNTTYTGNLRYPSRGPVTVTCNAVAETITIERNGGVALGGETEILHIDSYNPSTGELVTSHYAGAELGFKVIVNEAYDLVLSHPTGFGANQEEIILIKK